MVRRSRGGVEISCRDGLADAPTSPLRVLLRSGPSPWSALNSDLFYELNDALDKQSKDNNIGAVVLTGSSKAFAAGADIKEMKDKVSPPSGFRRLLGSCHRPGWAALPLVRTTADPPP